MSWHGMLLSVSVHHALIILWSSLGSTGRSLAGALVTASGALMLSATKPVMQLSYKVRCDVQDAPAATATEDAPAGGRSCLTSTPLTN